MNAAVLGFLHATLADPLPVERLCAMARHGVDWDGLFIACRRHGLFPLVNRSLQQLPPDLFPDTYRQRFRAAAAASTLRSLQMHGEMQRLLALFEAADIPAIPLKGSVLAERAYGDVGMRDFVDLDFLVPKSQVAAAISTLAAHGYRQPLEMGRRDWQKLLATTNEINLQHHSQPWLVEVHWDFTKPWFCLKFPLDSLWPASHARSPQHRLDDINTLLQLCIHGSNHYWDKLKWVVDVDRFVRRAPDLDWSELFSRGEKARCTRALLLGLALAHDQLALPLPAAVVQKLASCKGLPWLSRFAMRGWQQSGENKRPLAGRILYVMLCRETSGERLLAIWQGVKCRHP